jgi:hypothetical protein
MQTLLILRQLVHIITSVLYRLNEKVKSKGLRWNMVTSIKSDSYCNPLCHGHFLFAGRVTYVSILNSLLHLLKFSNSVGTFLCNLRFESQLAKK